MNEITGLAQDRGVPLMATPEVGAEVMVPLTKASIPIGPIVDHVVVDLIADLAIAGLEAADLVVGPIPGHEVGGLVVDLVDQEALGPNQGHVRPLVAQLNHVQEKTINTSRFKKRLILKKNI